MQDKQLYTVTITGGGSAKQIHRALTDAANRVLYAQDKETDEQIGDLWIEILEVCPYHERDCQD